MVCIGFIMSLSRFDLHHGPLRSKEEKQSSLQQTGHVLKRSLEIFASSAYVLMDGWIVRRDDLKVNQK